MRFGLRIKSQRHREEAFKLTAVLLNSVAIACLIGASVGPWLNPSMEWGLRSLILFVAGLTFHLIAQFVLYLGFEADAK
jgi:hypothetical protein